MIENAAMNFPEVQAAIAALRAVGELNIPQELMWNPDRDLLDWLGVLFGFQRDNVRNQREHLVLLLANAQMQLYQDGMSWDKLDENMIKRLRKKLTENYVSWCRFVRQKHNLRGLDGKHQPFNGRRELLYTSLFLLIWGEAANLRFMPECLCFIFHNVISSSSLA
jgi:callose synthase